MARRKLAGRAYEREEEREDTIEYVLGKGEEACRGDEKWEWNERYKWERNMEVGLKAEWNECGSNV